MRRAGLLLAASAPKGFAQTYRAGTAESRTPIDRAYKIGRGARKRQAVRLSLPKLRTEVRGHGMKGVIVMLHGSGVPAYLILAGGFARKANLSWRPYVAHNPAR
jgi:hypothetical protein